MRTMIRALQLLLLLVVAGIRTWWTFRKEHGVEGDDLEKEREEVR